MGPVMRDLNLIGTSRAPDIEWKKKKKKSWDKFLFSNLTLDYFKVLNDKILEKEYLDYLN